MEQFRIIHTMVKTLIRCEEDERESRRRDRSRINQKKYRQRQKASNTQLEYYVKLLHSDVLRLERLVMLARNPHLHGVKEYLEVFGHGYSRYAPDLRKRQDACLEHIMSPKIECMGKIGLNGMFSQWELYNQLFASLDVEIQLLRVLPSDRESVLVEAIVAMYAKVTPLSIETLFPHVVGEPDLVQKMIGKAMKLPVHCLFHFEPASKQVIRLDLEANVTMALVDLIGDPCDASYAIDGARIDTTCKLQPQFL